ncbi:MAG: SMI1/KNR4 family protein [Planctomycetota bacterium]|nr:SMI1/KNR4 family protein [Planctomycetota bacterium]
MPHPEQLDLMSYRHGALDTTDEDSERVDGIMFAESDHGDCYCFDLAPKGTEPPIAMYNHDGSFYEPYTKNFVAFVRRISE